MFALTDKQYTRDYAPFFEVLISLFPNVRFQIENDRPGIKHLKSLFWSSMIAERIISTSHILIGDEESTDGELQQVLNIAKPNEIQVYGPDEEHPLSVLWPNHIIDADLCSTVFSPHSDIVRQTCSRLMAGMGVKKVRKLQLSIWINADIVPWLALIWNCHYALPPLY